MIDEAERRSQLTALWRLGRIVPVITIDRLEDAVPLARALVAGGVRLLEITLRTEAGLAGAAAVIRHVPEAMVGIGTVLTPADMRRAVNVGARFIVSPGITAELLEAAVGTTIPLIPGVATASELMQVLARGFTTVKFFPASIAGGLPALRALAGPFPHARFCPTGGVTEENASEWLAEPNVLAVGGSWLTPRAEVIARQWETIQARAIRSVTRLQTE